MAISAPRPCVALPTRRSVAASHAQRRSPHHHHQQQQPSSAVVAAPRRRAALLGLVPPLLGCFEAAQASANVDVLRALERRRQRKEEERVGVSGGLSELQTRVARLRRLLRHAALASSSAAPQEPLDQLLPTLKAEVAGVATLSKELGVLLRCVRPTFDRFEGLQLTGSAEKVLSTLDGELDVELLHGDLLRLEAALGEVDEVLQAALQDSRQLWSFCFSD